MDCESERQILEVKTEVSQAEDAQNEKISDFKAKIESLTLEKVESERQKCFIETELSQTKNAANEEISNLKAELESMGQEKLESENLTMKFM